MKVSALAPSLAVAAAAAAACCTATHAFQSHVRHHHHHVTSSSSSSSPLFAKKKKKSNGANSGKGFGTPKKKYSIEDKSYGLPAPSSNGATASSLPEQTPEEMQSSMAEFFSKYDEWKPLFRHVMSGNDNEAIAVGGDATIPPPPAVPFLDDAAPQEDLWGISTVEGKNPWRLLESKPTSNSSLEVLSAFLDEWQQSLLDIPLDSVVTGDNDRHFLEEGRRTIAVTRFHVLEAGGEDDDAGGGRGWEEELFRTCWSEVAHLTSRGDPSTGSLVLLPGVGLEGVRDFVDGNLIRPVGWLGRRDDWEIVAMERGCPAVRLLYRLGDIPDLSERDGGGDGDAAP